MWAMAGPAATRVLADYGATVVRVESEHKLDVGPRRPAVRRPTSPASTTAGCSSTTTRQARPGARPREPRGPRRRARPRPLGRRGVRVVLAAGHAGLGLRLRHAAGGQPRRRHAVVVPHGPDRAAVAPSPGSATSPPPSPASTPSPDGPTARRAAPTAPTPTTWHPASRSPCCSPRSTTGPAPAQGQFIDFSQAEASLHLLSPALLDYEVTGRELGRDRQPSSPAVPPRRVPLPGAGRRRRPLDRHRRRARRGVVVPGGGAAAGPTSRPHHRRTHGPASDELERRGGRVDPAVRRGRADRPPPGARRGRPLRPEQPRAVGRSPARPPRALHQRPTTPSIPTSSSRRAGSCCPAARPSATSRRPPSASTPSRSSSDLLGYDVDRIADIAAAGVLE